MLTGLRPGELVGLRWADIHGNMVYLARSINVDDEETHGKNENAVRSFVMSDVARRVLDEQRNLTGDEESVFCIKSEQFYYYRWRIYCRVNELYFIHEIGYSGDAAVVAFVQEISTVNRSNFGSSPIFRTKKRPRGRFTFYAPLV